MTPHDVLAEADRLLKTAAPSTHGRWPRACALLMRYGLEHALTTYWKRVEPAVAHAPKRTQLLLLPRYAGTETAGMARQAWHGLSRAVHHHPYELAPTAAELTAWRNLVSDVLDRLSSSSLRNQPDG